MATEQPKYYDNRSAFWKSAFARGLDYDAYLLTTEPAKAERWKVVAAEILPLTSDQQDRLRGYDREMKVFALSGAWCGDCVRQGPMLARIVSACGPKVELRLIDRDAYPEIRDEMRILGAARVPAVVFLSEDYFEIGRFGDRLLGVYRRKAAREIGPACATGIVAPPPKELAAEVGEWVDIFERMLLMLRLAPMLRERHGD
jgi:thiol-disulfide isomerase/thioredoxin